MKRLNVDFIDKNLRISPALNCTRTAKRLIWENLIFLNILALSSKS